MPLIYRLVLYASLALAALVVTSMVMSFLEPGVDLSIADKDFANYWMAGRLIQEGKVLDLFGPQAVYFTHLQAAFGPEFQWHAWSYPPHYLLLIWPLGLFGYKSAAVVFLVSSGAAFLFAYRAYVNERGLFAWVAVGPLLLLNLWCIQNGYLSGALALGALALRDRHSVLAGILLGALTVKPQLGILFPFLLVAERNWLMIVSAGATTIILIAISAVFFGTEAWLGFINHVLPYQTKVMTDLLGLFLDMLPSTFGALRNLGASWSLALAAHWLVALPVALISILAFFRIADAQDRSNVLLIATFIVTPYALNYDLAGLEAAVAVLAIKDRRNLHQHWLRSAFLALAMILPVLMVVLNLAGVTIAPIVLLGVWIIALRQAGFSLRACGRRSMVEQETISAANFAREPVSSRVSASN